MWQFAFKIAVVHLRFVTENSPRSQFFGVNKISIRCGFCAEASTISIDIRLQNSRFFFSKSVKKSVKRGVRFPPVSLSVFSLVLDLLFDCSCVLEYAKIRTILQSLYSLGKAWMSNTELEDARRGEGEEGGHLRAERKVSTLLSNQSTEFDTKLSNNYVKHLRTVSLETKLWRDSLKWFLGHILALLITGKILIHLC